MQPLWVQRVQRVAAPRCGGGAHVMKRMVRTRMREI